MSLTQYILNEDLKNRDFTTESYYFHGTKIDKAISIFNNNQLNVGKFNTGWLRSARSYGQNPFDNSKSHKNFVSLTRSISAKGLQDAECFIVLDKDKITQTFKKYKVNPQDDLNSGKPWYTEKGNWFEEVTKGNINEVSTFTKGIIINSYSIVSMLDDLAIEYRNNVYLPTDNSTKRYLSAIDTLNNTLSGIPLLFTTNQTPIPILKSIKEYQNTQQFFNDILPIIKTYLKTIFDEDIEDTITIIQ